MNTLMLRQLHNMIDSLSLKTKQKGMEQQAMDCVRNTERWNSLNDVIDELFENGVKN